MTWKDISIFKFQQVEAINARDIDDLDKILFSVCVVYDKTEHELDNTDPRKVAKMIERVSKVFESPFVPKVKKRFGKYLVELTPEKLSFGQYVELAYFLQQKVKHAHYTLASLTRVIGKGYDASTHRQRAEYFLSQKVEQAIGTVNEFVRQWESFNGEYKALFSGDGDPVTNAELKRFNERYGWIYSASVIAEYQRIPLDDVFKLPVRQALNDLAYLKAKRRYEEILINQK